MKSAIHNDALRQVPLFSGLPDHTIELLTAEAFDREYPRKTLIFSQGDPADRFFVVLDGWVKLFRDTPDGNESLVGLFTRGDSFAEAAMFDQRGFPVNAAVVTEHAHLLVFPANGFLRKLRDDHELTLNLLANLSGRLRYFIQQLDQLTNQPTYQRVAAFLLSLCPPGADTATIALPCDKLLIAGRLRMKPESFSRAMARLRDLGVRCEGDCVYVDNVPALRAFTEGAAPVPQPPGNARTAGDNAAPCNPAPSPYWRTTY